MVKKDLSKKISIIILSWNTKSLLRQCLESIVSQTPTTEIIVVDNGSTDGSVEEIKKLKLKTQNDNSKFKIILNKENLGYGEANNQGMRIATGDYFLLLNSDTIIKDNAPLKMAQFLEDHPKVGVVGCQLLNPDGSSQPSAGPFPNLGVVFVMLFLEHWFGHLVRNSFKTTREVDWVMGAALMVRREVFEKVGPMDEGIFMYMDEVEWCYRIKKAGFKVMFYPGAQIVHYFGGSSKTGRREPILNIYRGLQYFYKKHLPRWQWPLLWIMLKLKAVLAWLAGFFTGRDDLKKTYAEALKN